MNCLRRFWIKLDVVFGDWHPAGMLLGCGVTAYSVEDAINLIQSDVYKEKPAHSIRLMIEDVQFSQIDRNHVLINMPAISVIEKRGIWFPKSYSKYPEAQETYFPLDEIVGNDCQTRERP
jgi:hypothetical protein